MAITIGTVAPEVPGATIDGPHALVFYKVTCPTCQMAAPAIDRFERGYPGRIRGVGQDRPDALASFSDQWGVSFPSMPDLDPYVASNAYGIAHVPTVVVVDGDGRVAEVVESWERDGYNRASAVLASLLGVETATISTEGDGLPAFRPG
jgi:hypothetical protein